MSQPVQDVPGIGPASATILAEHGIDSAAGLATAEIARVIAIPGFGLARATRVIGDAKLLVAATPRAEETGAGKSDAKSSSKKKSGKKKSAKPSKKKDKNSKGKKGKKGTPKGGKAKDKNKIKDSGKKKAKDKNKSSHKKNK